MTTKAFSVLRISTHLTSTFCWKTGIMRWEQRLEAIDQANATFVNILRGVLKTVQHLYRDNRRHRVALGVGGVVFLWVVLILYISKGEYLGKGKYLNVFFPNHTCLHVPASFESLGVIQLSSVMLKHKKDQFWWQSLWQFLVL